jgi:hypothetical protein
VIWDAVSRAMSVGAPSVSVGTRATCAVHIDMAIGAELCDSVPESPGRLETS